MSNTKKKKGNLFYAVARGRITGIFKNWLECNSSVNKVSGANYKGFQSLEDAELFLRRAGVQCKWVDFDKSYLDSISKDHSSTDSISRSRSPIVDRDCSFEVTGFNSRSRMECDNLMSNTSTSSDHVQCTNCIVLSAEVKRLSSEIELLKEKLENVENMTSPKSKTQTESAVNHFISPVDDKVSKLSDDVQTLMVAFKELSDKISAKPLVSEVVKSKLQVAQNNAPKHDYSKYQQRKNITDNNGPKSTIFDWTKCFVIESKNVNLDRDSIRIGICQHYGPTDISIINKYGYKKNSKDGIGSRFMIQINDDIKRSHIVKTWSSKLFEGSSVRNTLKKSFDALVIPNVPMNFQPEDILADVNAEFRAICVKRLTNREGEPLRAVMVQFQSQEEQEKALVAGKIKFPSMHNIILPVKLPNNRTRQQRDDYSNNNE